MNPLAPKDWTIAMGDPATKLPIVPCILAAHDPAAIPAGVNPKLVTATVADLTIPLKIVIPRNALSDFFCFYIIYLIV
jgi:hypothetical protein